MSAALNQQDRTVINDMPSADYHAHPAVSKSVLDKIARSPLHCRAYLDGERTEPTPAMLLGTAVHTAILEPERFDAEYAVFEGDRRTTAGKQAYAELVSRGKSIISASDADVISSMSAAVRAHPVASALLRNGSAEQSVFWTDPMTGLECKCRPDWWRTDNIVVDVKTTEDASPASFAKSVAGFRYHVQAAHYQAGTQAERFVFIAVEKKAPYAVAVYDLDAVSLELGEAIRRQDLAMFELCSRAGEWPGYSPDIEVLSLPPWAFPKSESDEIEVEYV